jgi:hypothetical protein
VLIFITIIHCLNMLEVKIIRLILYNKKISILKKNKLIIHRLIKKVFLKVIVSFSVSDITYIDFIILKQFQQMKFSAVR